MASKHLINAREILKETAANPLVLSLLLIALGAVLEKEFTCPCQKVWSGCLIALVIFGPSLLAFAIMLFHFRLCECKGCSLNKAGETEEFWENFTQCLIPPFVWIIIFFLDGDYVACGATELDGNYVLNKELNRKWCQPTEWVLKGNESDLLKYHDYRKISQTIGYVLVIVLSCAIIGVSCSKWCINNDNVATSSGNSAAGPLLNSPENKASSSDDAAVSGDG